jgi:hypothetical protein
MQTNFTVVTAADLDAAIRQIDAGSSLPDGSPSRRPPAR